MMVRTSVEIPTLQRAVGQRFGLLHVAFLALGLLLTASADAIPASKEQTVGDAFFSGLISDPHGRLIAGARIEINGQVTYSRGDGSYRLNVEDNDRYLINLSHPDFADYSYLTRRPLKVRNWCLVPAQIEFFDAEEGILLVDRRPQLQQSGLGGARFSLPSGALFNPRTGRPAEGRVRAAIATLDVSNGQGPGDWAVRDENRREGFLVSYGAVFLQFSDPETGDAYQLTPGRVGYLTLPVLPSMKEHTQEAPEAPFWYFDTQDGYWKQNGMAYFDEETGSYVGTVDHLSTINTDIAKFDNAACLKVTLDASVPTGNSLRIRYHSGGTPFGQTPTFIMNDIDNAAYRLPATTNVLLELLNPSNVVLGSLVVEDPPGSALVNTVVNTGPPIPLGNSLFPPAPYTDCKPIVVRLGMPQVEIRVNELTGGGAPHDNPTDDYLTWAPTYALARLATSSTTPVTVVLTNDLPGIPGGGNVRFAAHQSPWPINTTATANTLTLTLPAGGAWVPFMIAGEFGSPSTNDKDAVVEAHLNTAGGTVIGTKALMVRIRKDADTLTTGERDRFLFAWQKLRNAAGDNYILFQELHRLASGAGDEAHMQPAFLTWHRAMLVLVERELQKHEPSVALHYWDWDAAAPNVFTDDFMGAPGSDVGSIAEPVFSASNPLNGWNTDLPFSGGELRRNEDDHTLDPGSAMKPLDDAIDPDLVAWTDYGPTTPGFFTYNSFSDDVEKRSHNPAHGWPCGSGHLTNPNRSAADPLFYLLHSQIDRQWAYWQRQHNRHGVVSGGLLTFPAPAHYDNGGAFNSMGNTPDFDFRQRGSYLEDGMWPWDGTSGGTPNTVQWRPPNQATGPGTNVPLSTPMIPMTAFPASPRPNLWPSASTIVRNRHVIDYHGRFLIEDGLGFSYDDVAY